MTHTIDVTLFKPELVFFDFDTQTRQEFFHELYNRLYSQGYVQKTWLDAIVTREENYPTGLVCPAVSIGLPHTDPVHIKKPYIAFVIPKKPIEFELMAQKGEAVEAQCIVNLGITHACDQVGILQNLMNLFSCEQAVQDLLHTQDAQEFIARIIADLKQVDC